MYYEYMSILVKRYIRDGITDLIAYKVRAPHPV